MGQTNWLLNCHKNETVPIEHPSPPTDSPRNSYQEIKEIGPYMKQSKTNSYDVKLEEWKKAIKTSHLIQSDNDFEKEFQMHYQFCQQPLEKSLKSYQIMNKKHYLDLVRSGPPQKLRWACWKTLLIKHEYPYNPSGDSDLIYRDIKRTLIQHAFFQSSDGYIHLLHVLNGVCNHYPTLGYCQGMNFLAGFLLLVSGGDEYYSYQGMIALLSHSKYLLYFLYDQQLQLLGFLEYITEKQICLHMPALYKHLYETLGYSHCFWLTKMILTLFLYNFKLDLCLRLWDYLISEGIFYITPLIITILKQLQGKIMDLHEFSDVAVWFQALDKEEIDLHCLKESARYRITEEQITAYATEFNKETPLIQQLQQYPKGMKNFLMDSLN